MDPGNTAVNHPNVICIDSDGDCEDSAVLISDGEEDVIFVNAISTRRVLEEPLQAREDAPLDLSTAIPAPTDASVCLNLTSLPDIGLDKCPHVALPDTPDFYSTDLLKGAGDTNHTPALSLGILGGVDGARGDEARVFPVKDLKLPDLATLTDTTNGSAADLPATGLDTPEPLKSLTFGGVSSDDKPSVADVLDPLIDDFAGDDSSTEYDSTTDCDDSSMDDNSDDNPDDLLSASSPKRPSSTAKEASQSSLPSAMFLPIPSPPPPVDFDNSPKSNAPSLSPMPLHSDQSQSSNHGNSWTWSTPSPSSSSSQELETSIHSPCTSDSFSSSDSSRSDSPAPRSSISRQSSPSSPAGQAVDTDENQSKSPTPDSAKRMDSAGGDLFASDSKTASHDVTPPSQGPKKSFSAGDGEASKLPGAAKSTSGLLSSSIECGSSTDDDDGGMVATPIVSTPLVPQATPMFDLLINSPVRSASTAGNLNLMRVTDFSMKSLLGGGSKNSSRTAKHDSTSQTGTAGSSANVNQGNCDITSKPHSQGSSSSSSATAFPTINSNAIGSLALQDDQISSSGSVAVVPRSSSNRCPMQNIYRQLRQYAEKNKKVTDKHDKVEHRSCTGRIRPRLTLKIPKKPSEQSDNAVPPKKRKLQLELPNLSPLPSTSSTSASQSPATASTPASTSTVRPLPIKPSSFSKPRAHLKPVPTATTPQSPLPLATSPGSAFVVSDSSDNDDDDLLVLSDSRQAASGSQTLFIDKHDECAECDMVVAQKNLLYCRCGKTCCNKCLDKKVTNLLAKGEKGLPKCSDEDCSETFDLDKLPEFLPAIVMTILRKKIEEEKIGEIKDWLRPSERLDLSSMDRLMELPGHWAPIPNNQDFIQVTLDVTSQEYIDVHNHFHQTMHNPRAQITSIKRVQNPTLWRFYAMKRHQMIRDLMNVLAPSYIEQQLFHGTRKELGDAICRDNFDWRMCGVHGTAYGSGSYFARDASYSHRYTDKQPAPVMVQRAFFGQQNSTMQHNLQQATARLQGRASHVSALHVSIMSSFPGPPPMSIPSLGSMPNSAFLPVSTAAASNPTTPNVPQTPGLLTAKDPLLGQSTTAPDRPHHTHVMFLARVLTGRFTIGRHGYRTPPALHSGRDAKSYDSCVNHTGNPYIFVVFEKSQCYPEYLIEYTNALR